MIDIRFDTRELEDLREKLSKEVVDKAITEGMKELAGRTLRSAKLNTPHDTGHLRRGWFIRNVDAEGILLKNSVPYAEYVEYGHRQNVGQFVPRIGKRLKSPWVEGKFYARRTEDQMRRQAASIIKPIIEKELEKLLND